MIAKKRAKKYTLWGTRFYMKQQTRARRELISRASLLAVLIALLAVLAGFSHSQGTINGDAAGDVSMKTTKKAQVLARSAQAPSGNRQSPEPTPLPAPAAIAPPAWAKIPFYVDPTNEATAYYQSNPTATGANLIKKEGETPIANWFGDWTPNVQAEANSYVSAAAQASALPMLTLYNIPERDCGSYSAGGATGTAAYLDWVQQVASGIGSRQAIVILEPDALAGMDCLSAGDQATRTVALSQAVAILKTGSAASVYIDAGNPAWQSVATMASRLNAANIARADGFSLNVSNFVSTASNQAYGDQLSRLVGGKHYVTDVSRNGNGNLSPVDWCNNSAAALGVAPTSTTGDPLNDALLWVKRPWESDGSCNGAPAAGTAYWPFAIQLATNARW